MLPPGYDLVPLRPTDAAALAVAYARNREHLAAWEPARAESFFTEEGQQADLDAKLEAAALGLVDPWVLWRDERVVGRVSINNLVRGVFLSGSLGYWLDREETGCGLATAMVRFAIDRAGEVGLHRLEAGTLVRNEASQRVLLRCGFEQYGLARRYLFIAGSWQDHLLYQLILNDRPAGQAAP